MKTYIFTREMLDAYRSIMEVGMVPYSSAILIAMIGIWSFLDMSKSAWIIHNDNVLLWSLLERASQCQRHNKKAIRIFIVPNTFIGLIYSNLYVPYRPGIWSFWLWTFASKRRNSNVQLWNLNFFWFCVW